MALRRHPGRAGKARKSASKRTPPPKPRRQHALGPAARYANPNDGPYGPSFREVPPGRPAR
jgi:hypothetical protein